MKRALRVMAGWNVAALALFILFVIGVETGHLSPQLFSVVFFPLLPLMIIHMVIAARTKVRRVAKPASKNPEPLK